MLKAKELSTPTSCLNNAADDEPIFVLKSTDELAPEIVRNWAQRYRVSKHENQGSMTPKQWAKYEEALALANEMENWKRNNDNH